MPVPTASEDPQKKSLYEASTQYRYWRFSPKALAELRAAQNEEAVAKIREAFEQDVSGSSQSIEFLSADEEYALVKLYVSKIAQLCSHFRFPEEVEATAVSYLKRFYMRNTVMDYHPKNVMLTAIFLAAKTSNHPIGIDIYVNNIPKTKASDVLDLEFLVAQSLRFHFAVWHAHRALWGMWLDCQSLQGFDRGSADEIYTTALIQVRLSRLTDAELIYTPPQIALACFHIVAPALAEQWAQSKPSTDSPDLMATIREIQDMIQRDSGLPELAMVKDIDRRLKICTNPEKVVGSKAWLAKQAEVETEAAKKRAKKAEETRMALGRDPFAADTPATTTDGVPGIPTEPQGAGLEPKKDEWSD